MEPGGLVTLDEAALRRITADIVRQTVEAVERNHEDIANRAVMTFLQRLGYEEKDLGELRKDLAHSRFAREFKETLVKQTINAIVWFLVIGFLAVIVWYFRS